MNVRSGSAALIAAVSVTIAGCVSDAPPRQRQPADVHPAKLITAADGSFTDTDANRYRDSSMVVVYVMGDAANYQLPIKVAGEFLIRLEDPRGKVIAEWRFDKATTAAAMRNLPPGPGFVFELDLRRSRVRGGTDVMEDREADLIAEFRPEAGEMVKSRTSSPIEIGPVGRADR